MSHRARELGPIALRALQKESRLRVYKLLHSSLSIESIIYSRTYFAAADRFNPCTYCRANTYTNCFPSVIDALVYTYAAVGILTRLRRRRNFTLYRVRRLGRGKVASSARIRQDLWPRIYIPGRLRY